MYGRSITEVETEIVELEEENEVLLSIPFRHGPFRHGPFRPGPFRPGPFRPGPFRPGPVRPGLSGQDRKLEAGRRMVVGLRMGD